MRAAEAVANGVRRLRRRLGLTQAALAEAAGVHVQYVSQVERRQRSPTLDVIDAFAGALGVTAAILLAEGEGDAKPRRGTPRERVDKLLAAWPSADQEVLVRLLIDLRRVAARGAVAKRPR